MGGTRSTYERVKRLAGFDRAGRDDRRPYQCRGCDATFSIQYHVCPDCGGYSVDRRRDIEPDPI